MFKYVFITAWQRLRIVLLLVLYFFLSYFRFSAKKNFGNLKPPHENFLRTPLCAVMSFQFTHVPCFAYLLRQVAKLECWLLYCWTWLGNNNMATNLHVVTSSYGNRRFVACECWTQVIQGDSEFWLRIATYFIASCAKRSMINLKYPLLVWDWTLLPIMRMRVHRQKVSKYKQGFIESGFDCFGWDLTRLQLLYLSDAGKSCYCR